MTQKYEPAEAMPWALQFPSDGAAEAELDEATLVPLGLMAHDEVVRAQAQVPVVARAWPERPWWLRAEKPQARLRAKMARES